MGNKTSTQIAPKNAIFDFMKRKSGDTMHSEFTLKKLQALEEKICEMEVEMKEKLKTMLRKWENMENYKQSLKIWKEETELKLRRRAHKEPLLFETEVEMCEFKQVDLQNSLSTSKDHNQCSEIQLETNNSSVNVLPFSPTSEEHTLALPMLEVYGTNSTQLVFRPWISAEISAASQHLPDPTISGQNFSKELLTFCKEFKPTITELRRVLLMKMKPSDFHKITGKLNNSDIRCLHASWEHSSNSLYRDTVNNICETITEVFPKVINTDKVTGCRQKDNEDPEEFLTRLTDVFNKHSGFTIPDNIGASPSQYETYLSNSFVNGLKTEISSAVKESCIGWKYASLTKLKDHAIHAHEEILRKKRQKEERLQKDLHTMALHFCKSVQRNEKDSHQGQFKSKPHQQETQQKAYKQCKRKTANQKNKKRHEPCFNCGQIGHWQRACKLHHSNN